MRKKIGSKRERERDRTIIRKSCDEVRKTTKMLKHDMKTDGEKKEKKWLGYFIRTERQK
jgi:hypothetical protein